MNRNKILSLAISSVLLCAFVADTSANARRGHGAPGVLAALDTDGDGVVSLDEFVAAKIRRVERRFGRLDTDGDGLVSSEEFLARRGGGNDDIDRVELRQCIEESLDIELPEPISGEERFAQIDSNGDGFVELAEMTAAGTARATSRFDRIDGDGDGGLTVEEFQAAGEGLRAFRQARRACIEEQQGVSAMVDG